MTPAQTSEQRRIIQLKRDLTLQLYRRDGDFWDGIAAARKALGIIPQSGLPPSNDEPSLPVPKNVNWDTFDGFVEHFVGEKYRIGDSENNSAVWHRFFTACILLDPPRDQLLEFARLGGPYPIITIEASPNVLVRPPVLGSAIVPYCDILRLELDEEWYRERIVEEIGNRLGLAVDMLALLNEIERTPEIQAERWARNDRNPMRHAIVVTPETTKEDVLGAFSAITATQSERPNAKKPKVDDLIKVQCAIWRDDYQWAESTIADHLGKTVSQGAYESITRSETVRRYIVAGRKLRPKTSPVHQQRIHK